MKAYDHDAEEVLIGGCLVRPAALADFAELVAPEDFYVPRHARLWQALVELYRAGATIDAVTVADRAGLDDNVERSVLVGLMANSLPPREEHAQIVLRYRLTRDAAQLLDGARKALDDDQDPAVVVDTLTSDLGSLDAPLTTGTSQSVTLDAICERAEELSPWVVRGVFRRGWRVILVGGEGKGKSVLTRQIAGCVAQGVHPFTFERIRPVRTMILDPENDAAAIAETGRTLVRLLRQEAGEQYDPERLQVLVRTGGVNLRTRRDRLEVEAELARHRPELLVVGSLYQTFAKDPRERDDDATAPLLKVLDRWRARYGVALLIEHHAPHSPPGVERDMRPYGSSLLLRWPEIGLGLNTDSGDDRFRVTRWRGSRQRNAWPPEFYRGARGIDWPWRAYYPPRPEEPNPCDP